MREYLVTLLLAAALCYVVTPFVRLWAIKFGAVAAIRKRDIHTTPTPRWGGLAMWIAMALTFAMVNHLSLVGKSFGRESLGIFLAATLLVAIGLVDDRFELDALTKLAGQALAAVLLKRARVHVTSVTSAPRAAYSAIVAPLLMVSSSGCACTRSMR